MRFDLIEAALRTGIEAEHRAALPLPQGAAVVVGEILQRPAGAVQLHQLVVKAAPLRDKEVSACSRARAPERAVALALPPVEDSDAPRIGVNAVGVLCRLACTNTFKQIASQLRASGTQLIQPRFPAVRNGIDQHFTLREHDLAAFARGADKIEPCIAVLHS